MRHYRLALREGLVMKQRSRVLGLLCLLLVITYLDRVCISVSGPRMQEALSISPVAWGWVTGTFTLAYAAFEIPSGTLGDRIGPRLVLTRIVLWWSSFTALTGLVSSYYPLVLVRFLFGMGEAGAFPNASIAVSRWFPVTERGRAFGLMLMSSQLGGALAPLLVVPIQAAYGWRASFLRLRHPGRPLERRVVRLVSRFPFAKKLSQPPTQPTTSQRTLETCPPLSQPVGRHGRGLLLRLFPCLFPILVSHLLSEGARLPRKGLTPLVAAISRWSRG